MLVALLGTAVLYAIGWLVTGRRRDGLVPAAIVGGVLGLVLRQFGVLPGSIEAWQEVAYHLFGISFLAIGLTRSERSGVTRGALWLGVGAGLVFAVQAVVGGLVTVAWRALGRDLFPAFGYLAPMGLEEGPGQAVSIGGIWESMGFTDAVSLGATVASLGFVVAYGLGLWALRLHGRRRGGPDRSTREPDAQDHVSPGSLAGSAAAVVAGYVVLYVLVGALAGLAGEEVRDTVLGILFFLALLVGLGVRTLVERTGRRIPAEPQRRIAVAAVDGLTVAILASLAWASIAADALPLAVLVVTTVLATIAAVVLLTRRLPQPHRFTRGLALFGTVTGTVSSGLALVSLADPDDRDVVAVELGAAVVPSAPLVLGGVAVATATAQGAVSLPLSLGVFAVVGVGAWVATGLLARRMDTA